METITITEIGCHLDNHRGHYIGRDTIELAVGYGFIIGPFEKFAVEMYQDHDGDQEFPFEAMIELCDEAVNWLNSGQDKCPDCTGGYLPTADWWTDIQGAKRCKTCSGHGRAPRIAGQNFPPIIPEWTQWRFNEGDFGLYYIESDECPVCNADGTHLTDAERDNIENTTGEPWWLHNCSH